MRHGFFEITENNRLACYCGQTYPDWPDLQWHVESTTERLKRLRWQVRHEERPMMKSKWPSVPGEATRALDAEADEEEQR